MYYLVKGKIRKTPYLGEPRTKPDKCLVIANSIDEAYMKYNAYWIAKSDPYGTTYQVLSTKVCETID